MEENKIKCINDSEVNDFVRRFKEILLELESKRKLLKEHDKELQKVTSEKSFLQQELEKVQHEKHYIQKQLDEMKKISRQREEEWSNFRDNWAQNKIKFEISNKSSDAYKTQISNQQQEISKLKAEKEELERQNRDNLTWKEKCLVTQNRVESTMELLIKQIRSLEQDHIKLDSTTKAAIIVANKTEQFKNNYENVLKNHIEENATLKKTVVELSMKFEEMKITPKTEATPTAHAQFELMKILDEWKEYQEGSHKDVQQHFDKISEIYDCITKLQTSELEAMKTIKKLEAELEEERNNKNPEVQNFECQVDIPEENILDKSTSEAPSELEPVAIIIEENK